MIVREEIIGDCRLILGDARDVVIDPVDLVLTDPPYGITSNKWDTDFAVDWIWSLRAEAYVMTASQPFTSKLVMAKQKWFRHEWVWIKNRGSNFANTVREPMKEHESVLVFAPGKWTYNRQMQERTGAGADRVKYGVAFRSQSTNYREFEGRDHQKLPEMRVPSSWQKFNCEVGKHPTQKPVPLFEYLVRTYSNAGDVICDPFMGSGTTGVACINERRRFIGIEMNEQYFETACQRVREAHLRSSHPTEPKQASLFDPSAA